MKKPANNNHTPQKKLKDKQQKKEPVVDLVTGATSGLGLTLIEKLLERGDIVHVIIRERPSASEDWKRLPPGVIPFTADLRLRHPTDEKTLQDACKGVNNVFHLAGATYIGNKFTFNDYIESNVIGTENLLKACLDANPENWPVHVIYPSSIAVYGNERPGEILTEESETRPSRPYSDSKLMAEQVIKSFAEAKGNLRYTILRLGTMYGPNYDYPYFTKVLRYIKEGKMRYVGKGTNHLTLVHADDVVKAMLMVTTHAAATNKTYNVTDGEAHAVRQLFEMAAKFLNVPAPHASIHPTIAIVTAKVFNMNADELEFLTSDRVISTDKIRKELNFMADRRIEVGVASAVERFLEKYKGQR